MMRYGRPGDWHGKSASLTLPSLVPSLWLLWLAFASMVSPFVSSIAWALAASMSMYLLALSTESVRLSLRDRASIWRLPLVFAAIHVGYGWGFLREAFATWPNRISQFLRLPRVAATR